MGGSEFAHPVHTDEAQNRLQPNKDVACSDFSRPHPSSAQPKTDGRVALMQFVGTLKYLDGEGEGQSVYQERSGLVEARYREPSHISRLAPAASPPGPYPYQ